MRALLGVDVVVAVAGVGCVVVVVVGVAVCCCVCAFCVAAATIAAAVGVPFVVFVVGGVTADVEDVKFVGCVEEVVLCVVVGDVAGPEAPAETILVYVE